MKRLFRLKSEMVGDRRVAVHRITCVCGHTTTVSSSHGGNPLPPEAVARHFRLRGWEVSDREGSDLCATCVENRKKARRTSRLKLVDDKAKDAAPEEALDLAAQAIEAMKEPTVAEPAKELLTPEAQPAAAQREMTREDRRIIFAAINDVYLDADRGYKPGMTDARVAEAFGVPLQWVSDLRTEMFGPSGESVEVREMLDQIETLRDLAAKDLEQMRGVVDAASRRMDELSQRLNMLSVQATRLTEALA
jgi:hypothetical protein